MNDDIAVAPPSVIAFDVDGVLVRARDERGFYWHQELSRDFGIATDEIELFFRNDWDACIVGDADLYDVLPPYLERWGYTGDVNDFLDYWFEHDCRLDGDLLAAIDRLSSASRLVIATNQDRHRTRYLWDQLDLRSRFEWMFSSSELGVRKPDHGFWHRVTAALDTESHADILLVDDSEANVAAARNFGWRAIHYRDRSDLDGLLASTQSRFIR